MTAYPRNTSTSSRLLFILLATNIYCIYPGVLYAHAESAYGCSLNENLCDADESCIPDGLFGECLGEKAEHVLVISEPLDSIQNELLTLELARLKAGGFDWTSSRTQCVLAYFKLSLAFQLVYDADFCDVRNPQNVWQLLQVVKSELSKKNRPVKEFADYETAANAELDEELQQAAAQLLQQKIIDDLEDKNQLEIQVPDQSTNQIPDQLLVRIPDQLPAQTPDQFPNQLPNELPDQLPDQLSYQLPPDPIITLSESHPLTQEEETRLRGFLQDVLSSQPPDLSSLNQEQAQRLSKYVNFLQSTLMDSQGEAPPAITNPGEAEEAVPLNVEDDWALPLKKDTEHLGDQNNGLDNVEHKIVKGASALARVDGSRVYLRVSKDLSEAQLYQLVAYLEHYIAGPNKLLFDEFQFDGDQLSFRVSRASAVRSRNSKRQIDSAEGIAEAVYKRRKDIETLSGVRVDETGIGSGQGVVPVESEGRDGLFMPILVICAFTITAMVSVLAVHHIKQRQRNKKASAIPELAEQIEGKSSALYQDLCRHRMSNQEPSSGTNSKHSSTSSWSEEPISHSNMDISTGHVILNFLQEYLSNPTKIEEQWSTLSEYFNLSATCSVAEQTINMDKNRTPKCLPYDDTLISVQSTPLDESASTYINASAIHDSDPRQPTYIATQSPLPTTTPHFWQMVWEQGAVLIVNLTNEEDTREERCMRYWPENGSQLHGAFEIHLVSEHIWSEDYVVRSFYLKNLKTNETRTITQFHYVTWPYKGVPANNKALLEFRRKVNKSYRGRAAPIVVHCTDGVGRTGTYCLIDIVLNRINKGVKELNIAGSLEHLRDQRRGMVSTGEQYKLVFSCLAEEVNAMVKALPR